MRHTRLALSLAVVAVGLGAAGFLLLRGSEEECPPHASLVDWPPTDVALEEPVRAAVDEGRALVPPPGGKAVRREAGPAEPDESTRVGVTLRVLDSHDRTPVEGALVRVLDREWLTDESGECTASASAEFERFDVSVEKDGYSRCEESCSRDQRWPLLLHRAVTLAGRDHPR